MLSGLSRLKIRKCLVDMEAIKPARLSPKRYRRKFGQPKYKRPTSPRRQNWAGSKVRQFKHKLALIGWMQLIYGREHVAKVIASQLTDSTPVETIATSTQDLVTPGDTGA